MFAKEFVVTKELKLDELNATLRELEHEPSGAKIMHIENDDPENLFCLSFETLPYNSNGVAHILEHTVLCGSKKFPVKDPFFAMTRRSLNTFMNALTGSDFTCYPAASQVEKDFYNLLEVYCDAVFHPQLKRVSFLQEGHRFEITDSKLEWKGIVYNEMKGALNSPESRLWHAMMASLVPDLTYAYISGGDPKVIPTLTYEQLITFHEIYYHPSRCLFFFYGNLPLTEHLEFLKEKALKHVTKQPPPPPSPLQKRFTAPVYNELRYPMTEMEDLEKKAIISFGWLTAPVVDQETILALSVLDSILMDTDASPLKLPLLESELCIQADAYMDTEMTEVPYVIVCKGCRKDDADEIEKLLMKSLEEIIEEGIPTHLIEAALHQLEFSRMEIGGDHTPFGLTLFMRSALAKQHGCPPENALLIHSLFDRLRKKMKDPHYLTNILKEQLLCNRHFVRQVMTPDVHLSEEESAEEKKRLQEIAARLTPEDKEMISKQAKDLARYQEETERQNLDCLPKVTLDDVPSLVRDFPLKRKEEVFHHNCFTNHIVYADLIFDLPYVEEADLPFVQLLITLLPELGMGSRDWQGNLEYLQEHTGGVGSGLVLAVQSSNYNASRPFISMRGKALERKADKLFEILKEMAVSPHLDDEKRIHELLLQIHTSLENRLTRNGLRYATQLALAGSSIPGKINNIWHGLDYMKSIQEMIDNPKLVQKLLAVKERVLSFQNPHLVISCDDKMHRSLEKKNFFGVLDLPRKESPAWRDDYPVPAISSQARPIAAPVAATCEAFKVCAYQHPHAPALNIAAQLLDNKILHRKVREEGGAYGCGASYNPMSGSFYFSAFRDPHIARTLKIFEESIDFIAGGNFDDKDLEEAKLGIIQHFDAPVAPGSRALTAYSWWREGRTKEMRQSYRDALLDLTSHEVKIAFEKELMHRKGKGVTVTFASQELLERENALLAKEQKTLPIIPVFE